MNQNYTWQKNLTKSIYLLPIKIKYQTLLLIFIAPDWNGHFALQPFLKVEYKYIPRVIAGAPFRKSD